MRAACAEFCWAPEVRDGYEAGRVSLLVCLPAWSLLKPTHQSSFTAIHFTLQFTAAPLPWRGAEARSCRATMLHADKQQLERELAQSLVDLEWKELDYLQMNMRNLATSSAVLVGFGFFRAGTGLDLDTLYGPEDNIFAGNLTEMFASGWHWLAVIMEGLIGTSLSLAISFNLITLFVSTVSAMTGPGLALRGPEGSVGRAVKHMEKQNQRALRFFGRGITAFTFHLTVLSLRSWFGLGFIDGMTGVVIGIYTIHIIFRYGADIGERFYVSPSCLVRGAFTRGDDGIAKWERTPEERRQADQAPFSAWTFPLARLFMSLVSGGRWRPPGHGRFTPLWRLDKVIAFPHIDEPVPGDRSSAGSGAPSPWRSLSGGVGRGQRLHHEAVEDLLLRMQGPYHAEPPAREHAVTSPGAACGGAGVGASAGVGGQWRGGCSRHSAPPMAMANGPDLLEQIAAHMSLDGTPLLGGGRDGRAEALRRSHGGGPGWLRQLFGGGAEQVLPRGAEMGAEGVGNAGVNPTVTFSTSSPSMARPAAVGTDAPGDGSSAGSAAAAHYAAPDLEAGGGGEATCTARLAERSAPARLSSAAISARGDGQAGSASHVDGGRI